MVVWLDDIRAQLARAGNAATRSRTRVAGWLSPAAPVAAAVAGTFFALLTACTGPGAHDAAASVAPSDSISRARQDSINRAKPGYVVDSMLPVAEALQRFRTAIGGAAAVQLTHASASREALVRELLTALAASDTGRLSALTLTAREFADLVYPESPYTRPPMQQAPALVWAQITNASQTGFGRLVRRAGGLRLRIADHRCNRTPQQFGRNRIWTGCVVRITNAGGTVESHRLFGSIIERDDRFKIVSWAGEF